MVRLGFAERTSSNNNNSTPVAVREKRLKFTPPGTTLAPSGALVLGRSILVLILTAPEGLGRPIFPAYSPESCNRKRTCHVCDVAHGHPHATPCSIQIASPHALLARDVLRR